jgi:WD40 repeat protein
LSQAADPPARPRPRQARPGPFQGLIPYTEDDAAYFFGRDAARAVVLDNLLAYRVSILFGASGVGKSSLLRAGVVRHVRDEGRRQIARGEPAEYAALHFSAWSDDPLAGLQRAIGAALRELSPELADGLPEGGSLADTVAAAALRVDGALLVILDQFEEYFLYHDADGPFITQLARLLARRDTAASVLIAIREDALAKLDALAAHMPGLLDNLVRIEHLDRAAARAAVTEPLELWNREEAAPGEEVRIEPELVEAVLDGVQTGAVATGDFGDGPVGAGPPVPGPTARAAQPRIQTPYLQIVLTRLWEEERAAGSRLLRVSTLVRLGGAERIVAEHVDIAIATLTPAEQLIAAGVLRQLVTPSGTKIALRAADLADLAGLGEPAVSAVLERLTREARILQATGDARYEIYHDALARPILEWRRRWQAGQDRLRERRRNRIVAAVAAGLVLTVLVVATLAVLAWVGRRDAERQARDARAVALASASRDAVATQPDVALLLGLAALRERDRYETRNSLITARQAAGPEAVEGIIRGHSKAVVAAGFVQHGRTIVSAGADGRLLLTDVATHRRRARPFPSNGRIGFTAMAISRDQRFVATGDEADAIRIWDVATRRLFAQRAGQSARALAFSPDGRTLASGGSDSRIRLWDVETLSSNGRALKTPPRWSAGSLAFSRDGGTLAAVGNDEAVRRWSVRTRRRVPGVLSQPGASLQGLAFSPDGRTLATGGGRARLWDLRTGRVHAMATGFADPEPERLTSVAFSPDGRQLAGAGEDGATHLWDVRTGAPARPPMHGPTDVLNGIAFSSDARTVAVFGEDTKVWLLDTARPELLDHPDGFDALAFDRTGRVLATASTSGLSTERLAVRFWDLATGRVARTSRVGAVNPDAITFGPGANVLATGSAEGRVAVWNLRRRRAVGSPLLPGHPRELVFNVAFSPSGDVLASSAETAAVTLWNIASHRATGQPLHDGRAVDTFAFSPDGRTLAVAGAGRVRLWDVTKADAPAAGATIPAPDVRTIAFSPDGHTLAYADDSGGLRLVKVAAGGISGSIDAGEAIVFDLAFSPDGRTLIAGDQAGAVKLWDVAGRRRLGGPMIGSTGVSHVAVSPDGRTFAADGAAFSVRLFSHVIWHDEDELSDAICDLVGSGLSRSEWRQYAPGIGYRRVCDR